MFSQCYTFAQPAISLCCMLTETKDTVVHIDEQKMSRLDYTDANTKPRLFKYIENFTTKTWKFSDKNSDIFHISAQNIDCGYSLEPPRRGGSNEDPQSVFEQK